VTEMRRHISESVHSRRLGHALESAATASPPDTPLASSQIAAAPALRTTPWGTGEASLATELHIR